VCVAATLASLMLTAGNNIFVVANVKDEIFVQREAKGMMND
jgi:hypothetical protein